MYSNQIKMFEASTQQMCEYEMNEWLADHPVESRNIHYIGQVKNYYIGYAIYQIWIGKRNNEQENAEKA